MAKKTNMDRLRQLYTMCVEKKDVVEDFNSEKTAKAEYNKMKEFSETIGFVTSCVNTSDPQGVYEYNYQRRFENTPWDEIKDLLIGLHNSECPYKKRSFDCLSIKSKNMYKIEDENAHYSFWYGKTKVLSAKYIANCLNRTNTRKRRMIDEYHSMIGKMVEFYGVSDSWYLPSMFTIYNSQPVADDYANMIGFCKNVLDGSEESKIKTPSDKQINCILRGTDLSANDIETLNNFQCSELIDIILNWDYNKGAVKPENVITHYNKIIGKNINIK